MPPDSLKLLQPSFRTPAVDDPRKVVKVVAQDGKTGETRDLAYTNCKVIGNGSFGIIRKVCRKTDGLVRAYCSPSTTLIPNRHVNADFCAQGAQL